MDASFIEVLAVLLSLGDFGAAPNPKAPSPAEIMKYRRLVASRAPWRDALDLAGVGAPEPAGT